MNLISTRNQLIVSALSKRFNIDPKSLEDSVKESLPHLMDYIRKNCQGVFLQNIKGFLATSLTTDDEMKKWVTFADKFSVDSSSCIKDINLLNSNLASKSVIIGDGLSSSEADVVVFAAIFSYVRSLEDSVKESLPHLMRWMDYIQNKEDFGDTFEPMLVQKDNFDPPASKPVEKVEAGSAAKKTAKDANTAEKTNGPKSEPRKVSSVSTEEKKASEKVAGGKAQTEKKKLPEKVVEEKDKDVSVSFLKIQVGLIRKAEKHPSADSLLVEEIDTGDAKPRQVVSGLAKFCSPEELTNRLVVLITNVKPGKLRDVMSEGLVLCASNEDHTVVEPLIAPEGAKIGEIVTFSGHDGKPEAVLNPKKKQLDKITPYLFTDDKGVATFKGIPFMTSAGPCTSSISKASIK